MRTTEQECSYCYFSSMLLTHDITESFSILLTFVAETLGKTISSDLGLVPKKEQVMLHLALVIR